MPSDLLRKLTRSLLKELSAGGDGKEAARVADEAGGLACLVMVWPAKEAMPTVLAEARGLAARRAKCRADILKAITKAGKPLTRKEVVRAVKWVGKSRGHGEGTVQKALAEMTKAGELVNTRDKSGYRLPGWTGPTLFDDDG